MVILLKVLLFLFMDKLVCLPLSFYCAHPKSWFLVNIGKVSNGD